MEIEIDEERWPFIVEHCTFDYMRNQTAAHSPMLDQVFQGGGKTFFNKGTNGRWKDVVSAADIEKYERLQARICRRSARDGWRPASRLLRISAVRPGEPQCGNLDRAMTQSSVQTPGRETPSAASSRKFARKPPPMAAQCLVGVMVHGFLWPVIRTSEALGLADRMMGRFSRSMNRNLRANNPFRGYVPGKQDVFVMTLPKSGTNWMMQIAHQLIWHGEAEYDHIHEVIPWPDTKAMPPFMRNYAIPLEEANAWKESPEQKRVIKTHFDWDMLPYSEEARYIAVIRDPKDVFVSSYFFTRDGIYGPAMPSVDTWYKMFLSGAGMMGISWPENTAGYWAQRSRPNVLVLSFKSMKKDLPGTVRKVADFLGIRGSDEVLCKVAEKASFDYMKRIDHKFHMGKIVAWRKPGAMMRKGTQGGSSELLSPERQKEVDAFCKAELRRLGCDLPYEEFCDPAI